ncbi:MAG: hypothetical protein NVSMB52_17210 [Chloroflexota bacterium]
MKLRKSESEVYGSDQKAISPSRRDILRQAVATGIAVAVAPLADVP